MEQNEERIKMDFSKKELVIGIIETITKLLLGVIVFIGVQLIEKVDSTSSMNADVLNRVIEIKVQMQNNQERIYALERDFKDFQKEYYTRKINN
jgi:hypothetical protein